MVYDNILKYIDLEKIIQVFQLNIFYKLIFTFLYRCAISISFVILVYNTTYCQVQDT